MTRHSIENLSKNLVNLKTINLTGCWELVDQTMLHMLSKFTSLQFVSFANIYSLTDQTLRSIAKFTRDLRALDIR